MSPRYAGSRHWGGYPDKEFSVSCEGRAAGGQKEVWLERLLMTAAVQRRWSPSA